MKRKDVKKKLIGKDFGFDNFFLNINYHKAGLKKSDFLTKEDMEKFVGAELEWYNKQCGTNRFDFIIDQKEVRVEFIVDTKEHLEELSFDFNNNIFIEHDGLIYYCKKSKRHQNAHSPILESSIYQNSENKDAIIRLIEKYINNRVFSIGLRSINKSNNQLFEEIRLLADKYSIGIYTYFLNNVIRFEIAPYIFNEFKYLCTDFKNIIVKYKLKL